MYRDLCILSTETEYRQLFNETYCESSIITHQNLAVSFYPEMFDHAFFSRSDRRSDVKDVFDQDRVQRILWIKDVLQDSSIPIYQGYNTKKKKPEPRAKVSLLTPDGYVVIIRIEKEGKARFQTAYVINDNSVQKKIESNPIVYNPKSN